MFQSIQLKIVPLPDEIIYRAESNGRIRRFMNQLVLQGQVIFEKESIYQPLTLRQLRMFAQSQGK